MRREVVWLEQYLRKREQEYAEVEELVTGEREDEGKQKQKQKQQNHQRLRGRQYGLSECLCHNDLLSGNILLRNQQLVDQEQGKREGNEEGGGESSAAVAAAVAVHIIDYEYAAYNYRAFDIANHFSGKFKFM